MNAAQEQRFRDDSPGTDNPRHGPWARQAAGRPDDRPLEKTPPVPSIVERAIGIALPTKGRIGYDDYLSVLGAYPFQTHSMACGRNCCWALATLWRAPRQNRYWYS